MKKAKENELRKLSEAGVAALLPILLAGSALFLLACGDKTEPPASEVAQQQPLQQKLEELLKKAEAGDADAQTDLGEVYASGEGLPKDAVKAADQFRKAAEKGIARAQFRLGEMYTRGEGVPKDAVRASDLIKQAAANGYAKAEATLAAMYAKGEGVTQDEVLAYAWSTLALRQGEDQAKEVHDSVKLSTALRDEAEQLVATWQRGVALVRKEVAARQGSEASAGGTAK